MVSISENGGILLYQALESNSITSASSRLGLAGLSKGGDSDVNRRFSYDS